MKKKSHSVLTLLSFFLKRRFFSDFVAFSQYLNFYLTANFAEFPHSGLIEFTIFFVAIGHTYIGNTFREKAVALPFLEICREDLCLNICFWIFSCPPLSSLTFIFILGFRAVIFSNGMTLILNVQR